MTFSIIKVLDVDDANVGDIIWNHIHVDDGFGDKIFFVKFEESVNINVGHQHSENVTNIIFLSLTSKNCQDFTTMSPTSL